MKKIRFIVFCLFLCNTIISSAKSYTLFNSGSTDYTILVSSDASLSEKYAASELQYWLKEISGVTFPIVDDVHSVKKKRICVGYIPYIMKPYLIQKPEDNDQGFVYGNHRDDIYIVGGKYIGTLYGVYSFLENELSCRWYTKDVSVAPKRKTWSFKYLYDKETPAFDYRRVYYFDALDYKWSIRNKNNGVRHIIKMNNDYFSTSNYAIWGNHTFDDLLPFDKYFKSHPEYFSLREGKRTRGQLCLSNPSVLRLCKDNIREIIKKSPNYKVYSIAQNDGANPCQCNNCQQLVEKYGGESGILIWFVNQIAESLESEFPDKLFGTFAYSYSQTPPKNIIPRNNVLIRLCTSGCCDIHPLDLCDNNNFFIKELSQWSKLSPHIYIWDYVVSFRQYLMPFANFGALKRNILTYKKYNVQGVLNLGIYNSTGGDFSELRAYLLVKLLWNPFVDENAVIEDFMNGYYQGSSSYMRSYFDKIQTLSSKPVHLRHNEVYKNSFYSSNFIDSCLLILTKAEKAANNQEIIERVQRQKMVIAYLQCKLDPERAIKDGSYELVMNVAKKLGIKKFAEYGDNRSIKEFEKNMEKVKNTMNNKYSKEYLEYKLSKFLEKINI